MGKFSLGRKNNILMKKKECIYLLCLCISRPEKKEGKKLLSRRYPDYLTEQSLSYVRQTLPFSSQYQVQLIEFGLNGSKEPSNVDRRLNWLLRVS